MMTKIKSRIAPTPSGLLHIGNICNFVLTWWFVRQNRGELHLRIDDFDLSRVRDDYIEDIFTTLDWLGIDFDRGPSGPIELHKNYSQQLFQQDYLSQLKKADNLYHCLCSRADIKKINLNGAYPGTCREKNIQKTIGKTVIRFNIAEFNDSELEKTMGDFIVWRKDNLAAYQLVSVIEDEKMETTHLIRGMDLLDSTKAQMLLAEKLELTKFLKVKTMHHPLILDENSEKLSKSDGALSLRALKDSGMRPGEVIELALKGLPMAPIKVEKIQHLLDIPFPHF